MTQRDVLRMALGGVTSNKLRSLLTMLGVLIGVSAVIILVAVGTGSTRAVEQRIDGPRDQHVDRVQHRTVRPRRFLDRHPITSCDSDHRRRQKDLQPQRCARRRLGVTGSFHVDHRHLSEAPPTRRPSPVRHLRISPPAITPSPRGGPFRAPMCRAMLRWSTSALLWPAISSPRGPTPSASRSRWARRTFSWWACLPLRGQALVRTRTRWP